jgi:predicted Zn-dependent protease with MMP-like domain
MQRGQFEKYVAEALASIPQRFRKAMQNIAIVVEDEPSRELLAEMDIEPPDTLLGLYQGTPLTERHWGYGNTLPDRVLIFQGPHERLGRRRGRSARRHRGDADSRDWPLLRPE